MAQHGRAMPRLPPPGWISRHAAVHAWHRPRAVSRRSGWSATAMRERLSPPSSALPGPGLAGASRAALTASSIRILIHPATGLRSRADPQRDSAARSISFLGAHPANIRHAGQSVKNSPSYVGIPLGILKALVATLLAGRRPLYLPSVTGRR
jgi:hypothetical protein